MTWALYLQKVLLIFAGCFVLSWWFFDWVGAFGSGLVLGNVIAWLLTALVACALFFACLYMRLKGEN